MTVATEVPEFAALLAAEERHFWFRARNRVLESTVRRLIRSWPAGYRVLEVGCGNGNVLRMLEKVCTGAKVIGSELHEDGVANAKPRVSCEVIQADIYDHPFLEPFHLIGMFDVLEHLPDDVKALQSLATAIKPDGRLLLTVPAYMTLWSPVDVFAGHQKRYTPKSLRATLQSAGWDVEFVSPFMVPLAPLMWLSRRLASLRKPAEQVDAKAVALSEFRIVPVVNSLMYRLLSLEAPVLARRWRLPFGSSLLAVARRR